MESVTSAVTAAILDCTGHNIGDSSVGLATVAGATPSVDINGI